MKYEELYTRTQDIIDEIAERILSIGATPLSQWSSYIKESVIKENEIIQDGRTGVQYLGCSETDTRLGKGFIRHVR
jgi:starvation-inducible DNA-binding protein